MMAGNQAVQFGDVAMRPPQFSVKPANKRGPVVRRDDSSEESDDERDDASAAVQARQKARQLELMRNKVAFSLYVVCVLFCMARWHVSFLTQS